MDNSNEAIFKFLLSWIKKTFENIWYLVSKNNFKKTAYWIGENWLIIIGILFCVGVIIDVIIWFFRWKPHYVWKSAWYKIRFFLFRKNKIKEEPKLKTPYEYSDFPDISQEPLNKNNSSKKNEKVTSRNVENKGSFQTDEKNKEYEIPILKDITSKERENFNNRRSYENRRSTKHKKFSKKNKNIEVKAKLKNNSILQKLKIKLQGLLGKEEKILKNENGIDIAGGLPPPIDREKSFHKPVYPTNWRKNS